MYNNYYPNYNKHNGHRKVWLIVGIIVIIIIILAIVVPLYISSWAKSDAQTFGCINVLQLI